MPFVYLVRCVDHSLYVGSTNDLERRVEIHNAGNGGSYTSRRRPVALVYAEEFDTIESAARRERQIKRWTSAKKEALVAGDTSTLKRHSISRSSPRYLR
jgi:putative endonuclease